MKEKKFNIAVVGGGLTGSILIHFLISNQILKNITCCWIKPNNERKENRVSFYNQKQSFRGFLISFPFQSSPPILFLKIILWDYCIRMV